MATALARTVRTQIPKAFVRTSGSFLNIDINRNCIDMTLNCHAGDGTMPLQPIELEGSNIPKPELNRLKDAVDETNISSVVVSWDVQDSDKVRNLSGNILNSLDSTLRESHDAVTTTRPFYMLDGGGRRMGSLCLVRWSPSLIQRLDTRANQDDHQVPGTWLKQYITLQSMGQL